ncbi:MAG: sulfite exporter TauE/SafE family protein, partial [Rubripirellula sp.]
MVNRSLQWVSAGLVMAVGLWMAFSAWRAKPAKCGCSAHKHECSGNEPNSKGGSRTSYSMSALLGVAFGLLPCPSAMAAYFTSMSSGSPMAAYAVIGLFAAGIASSLTCVGIFVQMFGSRLLNSRSWMSQLPWPAIRAGLILSIGMVYTFRLVLPS